MDNQVESLEAESQELEGNLRKLAEKWRAKLADPLVQQMVKSGQMVVSPLVQKLLAAFPPSKPT